MTREKRDSTNKQQQQQPYVSNLERRYRNAVYKLRQRRNSYTKDMQIQLAHMINHVDQYGFVYQGHYVYDTVVALEELSENL